MRFAVLAALLLALLLGPAPAFAQPQPLVIAAGELQQGDIATVDRPILILGVVEGDVTSWSGPITVEGEVRGDVVSYAGTITLGPQATVSGNLLAMSGGIHGTSNAVAGALIGEEPVTGGLLVAGLATIFGRQPETLAVSLPRPLVATFLALVTLCFVGLFAALWPVRTTGAALALRRAPMRSASLGLLTSLIAAMLLPPLASLIALSLVGLPLLLPLLLVLQLPYLFGLTAIGRAIGGSASGQSPKPPQNAVLGTLPLLLPLALLGIVAPLASAALFYLVAGAGLGAAILSRGGAYTLVGPR